MAEAVYQNGNGPTGSLSPYEGRININQGAFMWGGRGAFTTSASTCTLTPRAGQKTAMLVLLQPETAGLVGLSYAIDSTTGVVTVTRTDTTSGAIFSFLVIGNG